MPDKRKREFIYSENAEYQKEYQKSLKKILVSFNPRKEEDMALWEFIQSKGVSNRIPYLKSLIKADMEKESK